MNSIDMVIVLPQSSWLRDSLARVYGEDKVEVAYGKSFPDGETYVRLPEKAAGKHVLIVQSLDKPQDKSLWELILALDAARNLGCKSVKLYIPYLAYSRQDKVFLKGEPISIRALLSILKMMGPSKLVTVDVHSPKSLCYFGSNAINYIPYKDLASKIKREYGDKQLAVLAPDAGAIHRAEVLSRELGCDYDYLEKRRDRVTGEITIRPKKLSVEGKLVVIVDDIISTGGTIAKAASELYKSGASEVIAAVSHAILAGNALEKLRSSGVKRIIAANTLRPREGVEYIDVTKSIAELLTSKPVEESSSK